MEKPHTSGQTVYIPVISELTGKPAGEAMVCVDDGDLAAHQPWYFDGEGVYAILKVLGTDAQIFMHDIVLARKEGGRVVSGGIFMPLADDIDNAEV
ncbi:MAG TPA: hypothetical protein VG269_07450 [Tepidisphaeraceae bacterium]|jgi:hypothetical protein|nr:hypothetical protein [Tepidisphaeraceae bacterium]